MNNRKGIFLMLAAVAAFAVQDGFSRYLAGHYNTLMVVMLRYWVFAAFVMLLALAMITATPIRFTSFEAFPLPAADIARALDHFPEARAIADPFLAAWQAGETSFSLGQISARIIIGDARETLAAWDGRADAWFLDGFSPAKNPELWSQDLMAEVARHTAPGGSFATYTAAGHVRRSLAEAGFHVERRAGHGKKRHMTAGYLA